MALTWALQPPRRSMNDVRRGRFSVLEPTTENDPESKGPAHYTPRRSDYRRTDAGNVALHHVEPGKSERELTLSDGKDVRKLLPAGPGSYEPPDLWVRARSPGQISPLSSPAHFSPNTTLGSTASSRSPRRAGTSPTAPAIGGRAKLVSSSVRRTALPDTIGPGTYQADLPKGNKGGSPKFSKVRRAANEPLPRPPPLLPEELAALPPVGAGKPGTAEPGLRGSPRKPAGKVLATKGATISSSPRNFNLHNQNSFLPRHKDQDFAVPPPGWYNAKDDTIRKHNPTLGAGAFTTTPRRIDLARRTAAPGPGTYQLSDSSGILM